MDLMVYSKFFQCLSLKSCSIFSCISPETYFPICTLQYVYIYLSIFVPRMISIFLCKRSIAGYPFRDPTGVCQLVQLALSIIKKRSKLSIKVYIDQLRSYLSSNWLLIQIDQYTKNVYLNPRRNWF